MPGRVFSPPFQLEQGRSVRTDSPESHTPQGDGPLGCAQCRPFFGVVKVFPATMRQETALFCEISGSVGRDTGESGDRMTFVSLWSRCILHADLDAFFASVEQLDDPSCRGQPVLVGGSGDRGVVAAASYEARRFGCRSAMPMSQARRMCPHAIVRPPRFDRYAELSARFRLILADESPAVEPLSVDEAFVDVTGSQRLLGSGTVMAERIRARTAAELGVTVSVGVATSKFVAKVASDMQKPDGCTVIEPGTEAARLASLAIERMWGVGPKTAPRLHAAGIHLFADLQQRGDDALRTLFGDAGPNWKRLSLGLDDRPVITERDAVRVGHEETFDVDVHDPAVLRGVLQEQCERVALRLRAGGGVARAVALKVRVADFQTMSRQRALQPATDATLTIWRTAEALLDAWLRERHGAVRLIGVSVERADAHACTASLFTDDDASRQRALDAIADQVARKYGPDVLRRAGGRASGRRSRRDAERGPRPEAG